MLILLKLDPETREDCKTPDELAQKAFQMIDYNYNEDCGIPDAYLYRPDKADDLVDCLNFIDGADKPDMIRKIAEKWNYQIALDFQAALQAFMPSGRMPEDPEAWLNASTTDLYALKKAVLALGNDFYAYADKALFIEDSQYFTTRITDANLKHIQDNPKDYACITVYPK